MSSSINIISPDVQLARAEVTRSRTNMDARKTSSERLVVACKNFDLNRDAGYFDKSRESIQDLIDKTASLGKAIDILSQNGIDSGTCKVSRPVSKSVPWEFLGLSGLRLMKREQISEVNSEIKKNIDDLVVRTALTKLGIYSDAIHEDNSLPETVSKELPKFPNAKEMIAGTALLAVLGGGVYFKDSFSSMVSGLESLKENLPELNINYSGICSSISDKISLMKDLILDNPYTSLGIGAAAIGLTGLAIAANYSDSSESKAAAEVREDLTPEALEVDMAEESNTDVGIPV